MGNMHYTTKECSAKVPQTATGPLHSTQKKVGEELDHLQQEGIIRQIDKSELASPIVVVKMMAGQYVHAVTTELVSTLA